MGGADASFAGFPAGGPVPGSFLRSSCSECGSPSITWTTAAALVDQVPPDHRARVEEGIAFMGSPTSDAWLCADCGGFGIMH